MSHNMKALSNKINERNYFQERADVRVDMYGGQRMCHVLGLKCGVDTSRDIIFLSFVTRTNDDTSRESIIVHFTFT